MRRLTDTTPPGAMEALVKCPKVKMLYEADHVDMVVVRENSEERRSITHQQADTIQRLQEESAVIFVIK